MARVQVQTASISKVTRVFGQFLFKLTGAFLHFFYQVVKSTKASLSVFVCILLREAQNCGSQMFCEASLIALRVFDKVSRRCETSRATFEELLIQYFSKLLEELLLATCS